MNSITQNTRYRQSLLNYAQKYDAFWHNKEKARHKSSLVVLLNTAGQASLAREEAVILLFRFFF